jgi:beta-barrel assembly-enhancing protease
MRQMTRGHFANIASIPLIFVGGGIGYAARSAAGIGVPMGFLKFSRGFEEEADYLGLQYMYKTGYDPQSFYELFREDAGKREGQARHSIEDIRVPSTDGEPDCEYPEAD